MYIFTIINWFADDYDTIPDLSTLPLMANHISGMPKNNSTPILPMDVTADFARRYIRNAEPNAEVFNIFTHYVYKATSEGCSE